MCRRAAPVAVGLEGADRSLVTGAGISERSRARLVEAGDFCTLAGEGWSRPGRVFTASTRAREEVGGAPVAVELRRAL